MMRIESVASQPDRAGRYTVKFEDGSSMRLYRQTVEDFGLYSGKELDETEFRHLKISAGQMYPILRYDIQHSPASQMQEAVPASSVSCSSSFLSIL